MQEENERNAVDIRNFLSRYEGQEILYCPNPGNGGDAFIAHATFELFKEFSIRYRTVTHDRKVEDSTVFYGGGGNLVEGRYHHAHGFISNNIGRGNHIVVLPHSILGHGDFLAAASEVTVICRETVSYDALKAAGVPEERLFLSEDLAFCIDPAAFDEPRRGDGTAHFLRRDVESKGKVPIPEDNLDISMCWNGDLWHDPAFTEAVCRAMALYINKFESVVTDRLHVGIMSALYGKKVFLHPNDYFKIEAVYRHSLIRYTNVTLMEDEEPGSTPEIGEVEVDGTLADTDPRSVPPAVAMHVERPPIVRRLGTMVKRWFSH